jgi:hypothetical protein
VTVEAQLFLHVLGAVALFGATGAVAVLAVVGRTREEQLPLARVSLWTLLALAIPAWVVMLVFGEWTKSKVRWSSDLGWIRAGVGVADAGLILLLVAAGLAYRWTRRASAGWHVTALAALASLYVVLLAVAWWAMAAKVPT